ncbi:MAG: TonB-dependent receptor, partial [Calditrichaeota bacterium]|nr:TonB-dependent receptor [Calditrichota bacterium]
NVITSVPGLFLQSRYGNHDVRISIRGFGSRSNSGIRGVRILLDGIPESEPDGQTRIEAIDFNSVGTIEIVRGNASSLYTNAPGGVINFINEIDFPRSFSTVFNESGEFGLRRYGAKTGVKTEAYSFLATYTRHENEGFRPHSDDHWHILNTVLETRPSENTRLQVLGYFVDGEIRLPGSLTREEFEADPFQANQRSIDRDQRRLSRKGRVGLRYQAKWGERVRQDLEITGYGTIKYFERPSATFRIINRYGLGASGRYLAKFQIAGHNNEFTIGGDLLHQTGPVESYENFGGQRSDRLLDITDSSIGNKGIFFQNGFSIVNDRVDLLLTGRYEEVVFDDQYMTLAAYSARRLFDGFTPKMALNWKLNPWTAIYGSVGLSFESPAGNELDNFPTSSNPTVLLNPDLQPQEATNMEVGVKANFPYRGTRWFNNLFVEAALFRLNIEKEIVPFEVLGEVFFRNAARTNRTGLEFGTQFHLLPGIRLEGTYTFSDFVYDQYVASSIEFDDQGQLVTTDENYSGNIVPSVPRHLFFGALTLERQVLPALTVFTRYQLRGVDKLYVDDRNSDFAESYLISGLSGGLELSRYLSSGGLFNLGITAGVHNLSDVVHAAFININSTNGQFFEAGQPRQLYLSARMGVQW